MKINISNREFPDDLTFSEQKELREIYSQHARLGGWGWLSTAEQKVDEYINKRYKEVRVKVRR